jgi:hypothetical protein
MHGNRINNIPIQFGTKILLLNNNNEKFDRAKQAAGPNASDFELLAHYDHLAGLIQDGEGNKLENGQFWRLYETWRNESEKMIEMMDENVANIAKSESELLPLVNENVAQRRTFLSTLMTIAAAIVAGLFFLFSTDYLPTERAILWAKFSGVFYSLFIVCCTVWLTTILSQEGTKLDKHMDFYKSLREDIYEKVGTAIRSKKDFDAFLMGKLEQSIKLSGAKILGAEEYFFWFVIGLFVVASVPVVVLFWFPGS